MAKLGTALRNDKGYYLDRSGNQVPSVSKVKDVLSKSFLKFWAAKLVAEEAVDNLEDVYRVLRVDGREKAKKRLTRVLYQSNAAAVRGTDLHDLAERDARGEEFSLHLVSPEVRQMLAHYKQFLVDFDVRIDDVEVAMLNDSLGYAGTADLKGRIGRLPAGCTVDLPVNEPLILDLKTGKGVYTEYALQLAAYANMEYQADVDEEDNPVWVPVKTEVDRNVGVIIHISVDGYEVIKVPDLPKYFDLFAHCRALVDFVHTAKPEDVFESVAEGASTAVTDALALEIAAAWSVMDLNRIYKKAQADGTYTDAHLPLFVSRKQELYSDGDY